MSYSNIQVPYVDFKLIYCDVTAISWYYEPFGNIMP